MPAQIEIVRETDRPGGWTFEAQVLDESGRLTRHEVLLAWADYNLWSASGGDEPSKVGEAALRFMLQRMTPDELGPRLDAATARRRFPGADALIPKLIQ